jgi:hypothetical protein
VKFKLKPQLKKKNNDPSSSTRVEPPSSQQPQDQSQVYDDDQVLGNDQGGNKVKTQEDAPQVEDDDDGPIQPKSQVPYPRVHQIVQQDHLVDNILGSIQRGVTTHSRLATFYGHYLFVSSLEPLKVDEALDDPDWVIALQ